MSIHHYFHTTSDELNYLHRRGEFFVYEALQPYKEFWVNVFHFVRIDEDHRIENGWCIYVNLTPMHPLYKKEQWEIDKIVDFNRSVTYDRDHNLMRRIGCDYDDEFSRAVSAEMARKVFEDAYDIYQRLYEYKP